MNTKLSITRYPSTQNRSLQAWNSADDHILKYLEQENSTPKKVILFNDRFGYLGCHLANLTPIQIIAFKSQEKAIRQNYERNELDFNDNSIFSPLDVLPENLELGIVKIPKSMELFKLYLQNLSSKLAKDGIVLCSFMTKYFNKQMLSIAEEFFGDVTQSLAWKKSRILVLKSPKASTHSLQENSIVFEHPKYGKHELKQLPGVFSSNHIDYATQFFIDHLTIEETDLKILDLASGNGILGLMARTKSPDASIHLLDDSFLAIESSKLNLKAENTHFHYNDSLERFPDNAFDLILSNPPFHFDFETNIEIAISLFKQVHACLKQGGKFKAVASNHLNFKTHLEPLFKSTRVISENTKFSVYECMK